MSNPIRTLSNNYIQKTDVGLHVTDTGTIKQTPAELKALAPPSIPLYRTLQGDSSLQSASTDSCRKYSGLQGLRQLKRAQQNLSERQPKCGWMYKPSAGANPFVSRGAFGTVAGPMDGAPGGKDDVSNGVKWYSDLAKAEMDISTALCSSVTLCNDLPKLGAQAEFVGYCKSTGAMIPIVKNSKGSIQARYKSNGMACEKRDIITTKNLNHCEQPSAEGFATQASLRMSNVRMNEGFFAGDDDYDDDDGEDADTCTDTPLSRECVVKAAQFAGCGDRGALINSLRQGDETGTDGYNSVLRAKPSFQAYQALMNPRLNDAVLKDGSATQQVAIDSFSYLPQATANPNQKLRLAAEDLCVKEGAFDAYDFCSELTGTTTITVSHAKCLQQEWKRAGGTEQGTAYKSLFPTYQGRQWSYFLSFLNNYKNAMNTRYELTYYNQWYQKEQNRLQGEFIGFQQAVAKKIQLGTALSLGVECIWIRKQGSEENIVLGELLRYASSGDVYPTVKEGNQLKGLIGITQGFTLLAIQELRSLGGGICAAISKTDGTTTISHTVNGFTDETRSSVTQLMARNRRKDGYDFTSSMVTVDPDKKQRTKLLITEVESTTPSPSFILQDNSLDTTFTNTYKFAHFPQEPNAPWLCFEVCDRLSTLTKSRAITLQEKRIQRIEFNVQPKNVVAIVNDQSKQELPGERCYLRCVPNSYWRTDSRFAYSGFRTITLLFRPSVTMNAGQQAYLFSHAYRPDGATYYGFYTSLVPGNLVKTEVWNQNGGYYSWTAPYYVNEWNLLVVQYIKSTNDSTSSFEAVNGVTTNCFRYKDLQTNSNSRTNAFNDLRRNRQNSSSSNFIFYPTVNDGPPRAQWAGKFYIGMLDFHPYPSFTGDVAWIHGYRAAFDAISMLEKEIEQTWKSSWIQPNLLL